MGLLYIVGTVSGVLSMVVTRGLLEAPDLLGAVAAHAGRARLGALLIVVMGVALAMVAALMFPILRRRNEALAIGYVIFRGALETATYIGVALCWLVLVEDARTYADSGADLSSPFVNIGTSVARAIDPTVAIQGLMFGIGGLILYSLLYRARLVPRWLSGWGVIGVVLYCTAEVIAVFGTTLEFLLMPLAVQEMVMAIWLIAKGFGPGDSASELAPGSERQPSAV